MKRMKQLKFGTLISINIVLVTVIVLGTSLLINNYFAKNIFDEQLVSQEVNQVVSDVKFA